jgi:tetratricopeptide (TPR) repeat protein
LKKNVGTASRLPFALLALFLSLLGGINSSVFAQAASPGAMHGVVVNATGQPVEGATVRLQLNAASAPVETTTDAAGAFAFLHLAAGRYRLQAQKSALHSQPAAVDLPSSEAAGKLHLVLEPSTAASAMEFDDQPNFTVAGVTDWTAVGGHGSDSTLRTSEDLARQTAALQAQDAAHGETAPANGAQGSSADRHRQSAKLDEQAGDPLSAVHEDEQAVRLDPSEQNYFAWGSELLLHRAIWQAVAVFRNGNRLHPGSARMLTALGTALFAGDLFDEAAASLCAASDLQPALAAPYNFMGRVAIAAPGPLACVEPRLARFAQQQPQNATANYLYAMAILKRQQHSEDHAQAAQAIEQVKSLLNRAVTDDPKCAEAYLQLGILAATQQQMAEAMGDYSKAIDADPQLSEAHYRLAVAYDRNGEAQKARQEFQLHDEIEKSQAATVERQRREVKQFLVVLQGQPASTPIH